MCGIFACHRHAQGAGFKPTAIRMAKAIRHRGPDWSMAYAFLECPDLTKQVLNNSVILSGGVLVFLPTNVYALLELPMTSADGSYALIANGEIYNHVTLRHRLSGRYPFKTSSDSEVIIAAFLEYGLDAPRYLDGIFAFVLYSKTQDRVIAARDPIGVISLYQGWSTANPDTLFFASELKSLHPVCDKIIQFPPGHIYDSMADTSIRYFQPAWIDYERIPSAPVDYRELRTLLENAVRKQLMTEVPFGVLLSGGLDSSLIASIASREVRRINHSIINLEIVPGKAVSGPRLKSFSIGLPGAPDSEAAREVARVIGTDHYDFTFTIQDGLEALSDVIFHLETFDVTTVRASTPMFLLCRKIKALGVKMVLSGEGSDEMFGGYLYFHAAPKKAEFHRETIRRLQNLHLADCLRANKSSAAWGVEARVPFLDEQFLATVMNIDPSQKMITPQRMEKYILRKAFDTSNEPDVQPYLPQHVLWRQKEQFSDGVGYRWIDSLKDTAEEMISDEMMKKIPEHWKRDPPTTKEAYWYRQMFDEHFPPQCASTVVRWTPTWSENTDPSGRAISTHLQKYTTSD
ncbi:hypothetical protein VTN77DRAFT_3168 [Rasamsonia byssochlamydoides]|uniref:uncharacterized protein n=1 Tax=Rasamsonia byssochlamydoides TaxID=89139 RepID=UPI003743B215